MGKYFGTDGIRGTAGQPPLDAASVSAFGRALGGWLRTHHSQPVIVGQDTRESGRWLAEALISGLQAAGIGSEYAGVVTTPAVAYLTHILPFSAGVMVSASHNPYHDNGLKVFDHSGYKFPDAVETEIEALMDAALAQPAPAVKKIGLIENPDYKQEYLEYLRTTAAPEPDQAWSPAGMRIVLDCAHGAASELAPDLFRGLGCEVHLLHAAPNGRNINAEAGALHPERMARAVVETGACMGVAFDGDADRSIFADEKGALADGDRILWIAGRDLQARRQLEPPLVIATVMSNLGLELALRAHGIRLERTAVGDRYVLERMRATGARLGGEQSGHIIFGANSTTGDGLLTAVQILAVLARSGQAFSALQSGYRAFPQKLINVRVRERRALHEMDRVRRQIEAAEREFDGRGRVIVRYSGTEPLARVMVEAESETRVAHHAGEIAQAIRDEAGI